MIASVALSRLADVLTTLAGLSYGMEEGNPFAAALMARSMLAWILPQIGFVLLYAVYWRITLPFKSLRTFGTILCLISWWPSIWNTYAILWTLALR